MKKVQKRRFVCVLSISQAIQLLEYNVNQPCHGPECLHQHWTRQKAELLVRAHELRWLGKGMNVCAWVAERSWKGVDSTDERGSMKVMQLVGPR